LTTSTADTTRKVIQIMFTKITLFALVSVLAIALALASAPSAQARAQAHIEVKPLSELEHLRIVETFFGGDGATEEKAFDELTAGSSPIAGALQSGPVMPGVQHSPLLRSSHVSHLDPSWRRIDTFGIRETWGYTDPQHPNSSSIAIVFATAVVPSAYQHCLHHYEIVTHVEVRIVPVGGVTPVVVRSQLQQGQSAVSIVLPPNLWQNAQSGRILAWTSSGNPQNDAEAVSDQEFGP